jgi:hypothetical protein
MDEQPKPNQIDDALAEIARIGFPEPAICTGWVLVSEWTGGTDSDYWTVVFADDQQPDWRQKGLLHHAIDTWGEDDLNYGESFNTDKPDSGERKD